MNKWLFAIPLIILMFSTVLGVSAVRDDEGVIKIGDDDANTLGGLSREGFVEHDDLNQTNATYDDFMNANYTNRSSWWDGSLVSSSNINIGGNVTASYFFGDGSELTGIQHGALNLFLHNEASDVSGSKAMNTTQNDTTGNTLSVAITASGQEFQNWTTDPGQPNLEIIPDGVYELHVHARKTLGGTKTANIQWKLYKRPSAGGETLLATSEQSDDLTTTLTNIRVHAALTDVDIDSTDRLHLTISVLLSGGGADPTVEVEIEGTSASRIEIPAGATSIDNFVPYTSAIKDLDLGSNDLYVNTLNVSVWTNATITEAQISDLGAYITTANTTLEVTNACWNVTDTIQVGTNVTHDLGNSTYWWDDLFIDAIHLVTLLIDSQIADDLTISSTKNISTTKDLITQNSVVWLNESAGHCIKSDSTGTNITISTVC